MHPIGTEPEQHLARTAEFLKFSEYRGYRGSNAAIRVTLDPPRCPQVTDRQTKSQFSSLRLLTNGLFRSLPKQTQFELAHGPLETEQEAIVAEAGIIYALDINNQRTTKATELDELMPIATVTR
jgi:hypothetical protein